MKRPRNRFLILTAGTLLLTSAAGLVYVLSPVAGKGFALHGFPLDDSWIHEVYARSIAAGQPFQYNPGEAETGATSPLWALLLAPGHLLHLSPVFWAKLLGLLLTSATALAGGWVIRSLRGVGRPEESREARRPETGAVAQPATALPEILFTAALPLVPYLSFAAVSGTEVPLASFLILSVMGTYLAGRRRAAALLAGLAVLARPEASLLLGLLLVALFIDAVRPDQTARRLLRGTALPALISAAVIAPWIIYCLIATGRILPSTFYAKATWNGLFHPLAWQGIGAVLTAQPFLGADLEAAPLTVLGGLLGCGLCLLGLRRLFLRGVSTFLLVGLFGFLFLEGQSIVLPIGNIAGPDQVGSVRNFYSARYLLPAVPVLLLLWSLGFGEVTLWLRGRRLLIPVLAGVLVLPAVSAARQHLRLRAVYSWNCRNIDELQVRTARWIAKNLPAGASVGVSDAGALRYFGEHRIVDLAGLNAHRLLPILQAVNTSPPGSRQEATYRDRFWRQEKLPYLAVTNGWHLPLLRGQPLEGIAAFRIEHNTICAGSEIIVLREERLTRAGP